MEARVAAARPPSFWLLHLLLHLLVRRRAGTDPAKVHVAGEALGQRGAPRRERRGVKDAAERELVSETRFEPGPDDVHTAAGDGLYVA